jgi:membrane-associated phospholipid phosphatase
MSVNGVVLDGSFRSWVHSEVMVLHNDRLSELFGFSSLWGHFVIIGLTALTLVTREKRWAMFLSVIFLSTFVCSAAKKVIREQRPTPPWPNAGELGYGMPSQHSNCGFAVATWFILRVAPRPVSLRSAVIVSLAAIQAYGRVYNSYHSEMQVLAGCVLGVLCAVFFAHTFIGQRLVLAMTWALLQLASVAHWL